jgi:hypothetical protein
MGSEIDANLEPLAGGVQLTQFYNRPAAARRASLLGLSITGHGLDGGT